MVKIAFLALKRPKIIIPEVFITSKTVLDIIKTICDVIGVTILHLDPAGGHEPGAFLLKDVLQQFKALE